jgi:tetrahydromethanopterin S-methyltransferase subunit B
MPYDPDRSPHGTLESQEDARDGATLAANMLVGATVALLIVALVVLVLVR